MATTTPSFGWPVPTSGDLVKNGATAIESLGDAIDASMAELKGGTTGQVLSKTSNTDMDFTWVAADDTNAIQNTIVDAKGDLIAASAADTPARLAVGSNGETLVADSSTSTGLRWQGDYAAGKNKIINGDFGIWQRGTSFTYTAGIVQYTADRFKTQHQGSGGSITVSRETFAAGQTDVPNNPSYYLRTTITTLPTSGVNSDIIQNVEDVRTFAGQTVTFSFYAKASTSKTLECVIGQEFGSGGSGTVYTSVTLSSSTVGTNWARFTGTVTLPSITGKTIGTSSFLSCYVRVTNPATGLTWDLANVQLEAGSVATSFQTATGTIQGELAACQRYYWRSNYATAVAYGSFSQGFTTSTTNIDAFIQYPVPMRVAPTSIDYANLGGVDSSYSGSAVSAVSLTTDSTTERMAKAGFTVSGVTANRPALIRGNNNTASYFGMSAEL
jgi:hypothetical protein